MHLRIKEVMTPHAVVTRPDVTLQEAAWRMKVMDVGALPVCDGDDILGIITDRDIAVRAVADGRDATRSQVHEFMTPDVILCREDDDMAAAGRLMAENQVRRLVVVDDDGRISGIISISDMALDRQDRRLAGRVLSEVSQPTGFES